MLVLGTSALENFPVIMKYLKERIDKYPFLVTVCSLLRVFINKHSHAKLRIYDTQCVCLFKNLTLKEKNLNHKILF